MNIKYLIMILLIISSCNNRSANQLWEEARNFRNEENLKEAITNLKNIIKQYPNDDLSAKAQFQIADIFLNDTKDYEYAINEFKTVIEKYPKHEVAKKSLFMIAYVYNNYINAYTDAIMYYNKFKLNYPNDELIPSVDYELNGLSEIIKQIDSLKIIKKPIL